MPSGCPSREGLLARLEVLLGPTGVSMIDATAEVGQMLRGRRVLAAVRRESEGYSSVCRAQVHALEGTLRGTG